MDDGVTAGNLWNLLEILEIKTVRRLRRSRCHLPALHVMVMGFVFSFLHLQLYKVQQWSP